MNQPETIEVRCSSTPRAFTCPGSVKMERDAPPRPESDAAREGTAAHWVSEMVLKCEINDAIELVDRAAPNGVVVDADMSDYSRVYTDWAMGVMDANPGSTLMVEHKVDFTAGRVIVPGTSDTVIYTPSTKTLHVGDFKYGYRVVEPEQNWQLISYGIGVVTRASADWVIENVEMSIIQPRAQHRLGPIRTWKLSVAELRAYKETIPHIGDMILNDPPPCFSGPQCYGCGAAGTCPTLATAASNAVDVSGWGIPFNPTGGELAHELLTLEAAEKALANRKSALEELAISRINEGHIVPSYSMKQSFGHNKWLDTVNVDLLESIAGVPLTERKLITPAAAKRAGLNDDVISAFTERPSRGFKLTHSKVDNTASLLFGDAPLTTTETK